MSLRPIQTLKFKVKIDPRRPQTFLGLFLWKALEYLKAFTGYSKDPAKAFGDARCPQIVMVTQFVVSVAI